MKPLLKANLYLVTTIAVMSLFGLITVQQVHSQPRLSGVGLDSNKIATEITNSLQPKIQSTIDQSIKPFTNQINTYVSKIDAYQKEIDTYQQQLNAIPETIDQKFDQTVGGITQQVQDQINNITEQAKNKIDELKQEVNTAISSALRTLTWGMLGIDGLVTALITWLIVRRITRQLKTEIAKLNQTIQALESQIQQSVESISDRVHDQLDAGLKDPTINP